MALSPEGRSVLRHLGIALMAFALIMLVATLGGMLWMDLPLLLVGAGMVGYSFLDARRAARGP